MKPKSLRAAVYVRQSVREDQGISQQIEECQRRVSGEGWALVDVYNDNAISATKPRGEGTDWARMLADIDAGRVDVIVSVTAARLLRRTEDVLEVTKRGVRVVTTRDGIDTVGSFGKAILLILVAIAESEIEEKEARAIPYRAARREAGHPAPGRVPFGYRWVPKAQRDEHNTRYEVVEEEAEVIRRMSTELLAGVTLGEIVQTLNDDGKLTRNGSRWSATTARRILISPFQAAMLPPAMPDGQPYRADSFPWSECTPGAWEKILEPDAVIAARGKLLDESRRTHDGDTRAKWLFTGIGRCGNCGGPLRMAMTKTKNSVRGYRCTKGCFQRPADLIEEYVTGTVVSVLSAPGLLQWVDDGGHDIDALRTRRAALAERRAEAEGLYADRTLSAPKLREVVAELDAEAEEVEHDLADALQADPLAQFVSADDVRGIWDGLSMGRRRAVLGALVTDVRVSPVGKGRRVRSIEEVEGTVTMGWRRVEHRVSWETGEVTHTPVPGVLPDARDGIAAALN